MCLFNFTLLLHLTQHSTLLIKSEFLLLDVGLVQFRNNLNLVSIIVVFTSSCDFQYDATVALVQGELLA